MNLAYGAACDGDAAAKSNLRYVSNDPREEKARNGVANVARHYWGTNKRKDGIHPCGRGKSSKAAVQEE